MTENEKQDAWDAIRKVDVDRLDLLYHLGEGELKTQIDARLSIRGRCQTLLILLITGISAAGMGFLYSADFKRDCFLLVAVCIWSWLAWRLFGCIKSTGRRSGYGSPTDNIRAISGDSRGENPDFFVRMKIFSFECVIDEIYRDNADMADVFNSSVKWSAYGLVASAFCGIICRFFL